MHVYVVWTSAHGRTGIDPDTLQVFQTAENAMGYLEAERSRNGCGPLPEDVREGKLKHLKERDQVDVIVRGYPGKIRFAHARRIEVDSFYKENANED